MPGAVKSSCRKNERRGWESEEQGEIGWPLNSSLFAEEKTAFPERGSVLLGSTIYSKNREKGKAKRPSKDLGSPKALKSSLIPSRAHHFHKSES